MPVDGIRRRETPARVREGLPLSPNEERYVLAEVMAPEHYGNPWTVRIKGRLDKARLILAIQAMCDRHEGRRTGYEPGPDGRFTRFVEARGGRPDIRSVSMPGASPQAVRRAVREWFSERVDLASPPTLNRYLIIQIAEDEHLLGNYLHHSVNDGETHKASVSEIFDLYAGRVPEADPPQYSDVWARDWRSEPAYLEAEAFWTSFLGGVEDVGEMPADGGDPDRAGSEGPARIRLPAELAAAARTAARSVGVSEFAFYYAVILVMLSRLTGQARVCTTFQSGGRRIAPGSEGVHGVFSNGLVLATPVDEARSIGELAGDLRADIRQALAHEAYPYHHIIQATGLRPRFGINWYPDVVFPSCPGLEISQPEMDYGTWEYDLNVRFIRHLASGGVDVIVFFRESDISRARAVAATEQFAALLAAFSADVTRRISKVRSPCAAPQSADVGPEADAEPIAAAFLRRAAVAPHAPAVTHAGRTWTYAEAEARARAIAGQLRAAGLDPGDRVAIVAERHPELVFSLLAAARLGAVFTLLDAAYPQARLEAQCAIAAPEVLLAAGGVAALDLARRLSATGGVPVAEAPATAAPAPMEGFDAADPDAPAYILFTSGSTGGPKGVLCPGRPLSRFTAWQARTYGLGPGDRVALLAGLSHDPLLREVFTTLSCGAQIVIPDAETIQSPGALAPWLRRSAVSVAHLTPALGQVLLAGAGRARQLAALREVFWGGDILSPELVAELGRLAPNARQTNFYGATETPQALAAFDCAQPSPRRAVPIGRGVNGAELLVVDAARRPLGVGEPGEIAVRSGHLSLGYLDEGAALRPLDAAAGPGFYATGDRGLLLPDGAVLLLGRGDDQVKVRGHRVELADLRAALARHPAVRRAEVLALGEGPRLRIVAFAEPRARRGLSEAELDGFLAGELPAYMRPHALHVLPALPLTPNGKVDRKALARRAAEPTACEAPDAGRGGAAERALIAGWSEILGVAGVTPAASFARLGGDSLSYVQAYLALEEVIGEPPKTWHLMSIAELAARDASAPKAGRTAIDMPILIRAVSIVLVVAGHFDALKYGGGATSMLMLVSGYLFGGLALQEAFSRQDPAPVWRTARNILVPTLVLSAVIYLFRLPGRPPEPYILFLTADLQDYSVGHNAQEIYLWFVHCLLHMLLLVYLALAGLKAAGRFDIGPRRFLLGLFAIGCVTRFGLPWFLDHQFFTPGVHREIISFLPTTHLATLALGGLIVTTVDRAEQRRLAMITIAYAVASAWCFRPPQGVFLLTGGVLLAAALRLSLPTAVAPVALSLAGASLWIYLTHFMVRDGLRHVGFTQPQLGAGLALIVGVAAWVLWRRGLQLAGRVLRRPMTRVAEASV